MKDGKTKRIDFSRKRLAKMADEYYNEGKYVSALRLAYKEMSLYGVDPDVCVRFADIYEAMGLQGSAINWLFRCLDISAEEDFPDIYEGLAVNYLNLGNESQSAYYYNKLIDADDTIPNETKMEIASAFSTDKKNGFRFVYPPQLADYSKEVKLGSLALKAGDCKRAIAEFSKVEKGSKEYLSAKEMEAVSYLLAGKADEAEKICKEGLEENPDELRLLATLAAVYLEQGKAAESELIAKELSTRQVETEDDLYKVATVCCENGLHDKAYEKFSLLNKKMPYDGRMLYFTAVAAYKCGKREEAEKALDTLCAIYPDAEVAKYYLRTIREGTDEKDGLLYFYHLPQEERERRCQALISIGKYPREEAQLFGLLALHDGYFKWCFDEIDGSDHDLQYLALVTAEHVRADEFIREVLLDFEVKDVLKIEALRMLLERNEETELGIVLCNIYKEIDLPRIKVGRKKHKKFIQSFAKVASKFLVINERYGEKLKTAAETLYRALEKNNGLDLIDSTDDCACAIFLLSGLKELGKDAAVIAAAFEANIARVQVLLSYVVSETYKPNEKTKEEKQSETD